MLVAKGTQKISQNGHKNWLENEKQQSNPKKFVRVKTFQKLLSWSHSPYVLK